MTTVYTPPAQLILSPITPDYVGTYNTLMNDLVASGTWNDLSVSATGTAIVRWIASVSAYAQGSIGRALQENYLDTARSPGGVFRAVRLQGVHIIRSRAGTVAVSITRTDNLVSPLVIPSLSQFVIGNQSFYNTSAITISGTGAAVTAILNRGIIQSAIFTGPGGAYQSFIVGSPGAWSISDVPLWAIDSNGSLWTGTRTGLWTYGDSDQVFFDSTLPDGTVECRFGDGTFGATPPAGSMTFYYVTLATSAATSIGLAPGATGTATGFAVAVTTTAAASINQDPPPPDFYKAIGPGGPSSRFVMNTRDEYRANALQYPGIIDALFQGQAQLNPSDLRYMNVIGVTLITTSTWGEIEWLQYKQYLETYGIASTTYILIPPKVIPVTINIDIGIFQNASVSTITTIANSVISSYFTPSNKSLGMSLEPSDLVIAIMESATYLQAPGESGEWIDFIRIKSPLGAVSASPTSYLSLAGSPTLNVRYSNRGSTSFANGGAIVGL